MARRVTIPAADDLFRRTADVSDPAVGKPQQSGTKSVRAVPDAPDGEPGESAEAREARTKAASGRIKHDEKMTVYVTAGELIDIEQARLNLRGRHGLAVDRGRLVREAIAVVLHDLDENGEDSMLVRRLVQE